MIILSRSKDGHVMATFCPDDAQYHAVIECFGTSTLPTPFTVSVNFDDYREGIANRIEQLNPKTEVVWEDELLEASA